MQVNAKANQLAHYLVEQLGVQQEVIVGVMIERSFDLIISILAILKAGGGYLSLDPGYPTERLATYAEEADTKIILTQKHLMEDAQKLVDGRAVTVLAVDDLNLSEQKTSNPPSDRCSADAISLILFTSGSTGKPKGVQHAHYHLRDLLFGYRDFYKITKDDVIMLTNTICFDVHVLQIFSIIFGCKLVLVDPQGHTDGELITSLWWKHKVTGMIFTVPFLANEYLNKLNDQYPYMRMWGMGGDAVPLDIVYRMQRVFPNIQGPLNSYGPTEGNVITQYRFPANPTASVIGRPDDNVHVYVMNKKMKLAQVGVPGELLFSGPRMAMGYYKNPETTAEKFIDNPCFDVIKDEIPSSMLKYYRKAYRTGDLVRWRPDGNLDYLGRIDRQTKVNGVRLELGEVETVMKTMQGVKSVVAAVVKDNTETKRLVGYVTPSSIDSSALLAHCRATLLPAMVPSYIVPLAAFPLLPNGKIDVRSLPLPDFSGTAQEYVPPSNETEVLLQEIWMDVLQIQQPISVLADYFQIGGSSLQSGRIIARIRHVLEIGDVPATLIFDHPSIREFSTALLLLADGDQDARRSAQLRSTTVPLAATTSATTTKILMRAMSKINRPRGHRQVILSAESTKMADYITHPVPKTYLSYILYMLLQLGGCGIVASITPLVSLVCFFIAFETWKLPLGPFIIALLGPWLGVPLFLGLLAAVLVASKWILFPRRLRPGIYPLFGWTYLRWITCHAIQRSIMPLLFPYIRRTKYLNALLRALGATIGRDVVIDTYKIFEPELVSIGNGSLVGEESSIHAAFLVPAGFLDDVGCLVISTTIVGKNCVVGDRANIFAGGRLEDNHSLRPYGTMNQPQAVVKGDMRDTHPHFSAEHELESGKGDKAARDAYILHASCLALPFCVFISILATCVHFYGKVISWQPILTSSPIYITVGALGVVYFSFGLFLQMASARVDQLVCTYKRDKVGSLAPGVDLTANSTLLYNYCIFKRLLSMPFFNYFANAIPLGLKIDPSTGIKDGITEFEAVTIGAKGTSGGMTSFRCVDGDGIIQPIEIRDGVSCGNSMFFPGCVVEKGAQVGNETTVPAGMTVPEFQQLQGEKLFAFVAKEGRGSKSANTDSPEFTPIPFSHVLMKTATNRQIWDTIRLILCVGLPAVGLVAIYLEFKDPFKVVLAVPIAMLLKMFLEIVWLKIRLWYLGYFALVKAGGNQGGESVGNYLRYHMGSK